MHSIVFKFLSFQSKYTQLQQAKSRMDHDMSVMQSKWEMNGGGSLADPRSQLLEHEAILRQKYEKAIRELDNTKKQLHNQHENDIEQFMAVKKQLEKQVLLYN